ncbi:MAG: helix-turn-helix domain-containing protein [Treponema sp.]|jgi:AraC-like DNA-binding protein|nr:helix-turn-helix domain-containing protein [Treponema sp.]
MYQLDSRKYWSDAHVPIQLEFRNPQSPFPLHVHDFHELVFVYSGKATHLTANGDYDIQSGDFINIKLGQAHGYKNIRNLVLMNILVKSSFFGKDHPGIYSLPAYEALFGQEPEDDTGRLPVTHFRLDYEVFGRIKNLIGAAQMELREHSDGYRVMVSSFMRELIVLLIRSYRGKECSPPGFGADFTQLVNYVKDNYRRQLDMNALTGISGMSKSHVLRSFKQYLGCPPFRYINRLRLSAAADELVQTDKSITEIALDLGFNDSNYFTRSFRKYLGLSPREYRYRYLKENFL